MFDVLTDPDLKNKTIMVGLSGGVDSSATALLLKEAGYTIIGVTMAVWDGECNPEVPVRHSCYGPDEAEDIEDARRVCETLGIPFHVIDLKDAYKQFVLDYFKYEYAQGRTPNPCVRCNQTVKFGALIDNARKSGLQFDYFATGHYARVEWDSASGRYLLKRARDDRKDQTYFISRLSQTQLKQILFPLGGYTKPEIKEICKRLKLNIEGKPESQNFAAVGHHTLLEADAVPGDILDINGATLGQHKGIQFYTIGQRRGIGLGSPHPLFVISINKKNNTITVGPKEKLIGHSLLARDPNWISIPDLDTPMEVSTKIRYVQHESLATVSKLDSHTIRVDFYEPQSAITAGQTVVFYDQEVVVGSAIIERALPAEPPA